MPRDDDLNKLDPEASSGTPARNWLGSMGRLMLGLLIFSGCAGISIYWMTKPPKAQRRPPKPQATLVEAIGIQPQTEKVAVRAMGTVVPARSIQLASRVSGQIVEVNPQFVPGGHFRENEKILQIEQKDYRLALEQRKSEMVQAQHDLKLEMGRQSVAQREYELLAQDVQEEDKELLLRRPQLEMAKAAVSAAEAALEKAQLDLERTSVLAPFNAMVQSRAVDLGSEVNPGTVLASLVGMDEYWVEVSLPVDELKWISVPGYNSKAGSTARVYLESAWGDDTFRAGTVERLMTDLEPQGRMARVLVTVTDPHELQAAANIRHPLILGSYVRVEIDGIEVPNVIKIPRTALREGNMVWLMSQDNKLDIRRVNIVWSGNDHVYISDWGDNGDLLITSSLGAPVQGMALRTVDSPPSTSEYPKDKTSQPETESPS